MSKYQVKFYNLFQDIFINSNRNTSFVLEQFNFYKHRQEFFSNQIDSIRNKIDSILSVYNSENYKHFVFKNMYLFLKYIYNSDGFINYKNVKVINNSNVELVWSLKDFYYIGTDVKQKKHFFICKDTGKFLIEQFNIWLLEKYFSKKIDSSKLEQINVLKTVFNVIVSCISEFDKSFVFNWLNNINVQNVNYIVSIGKIIEKDGWHIIEKLQKHKNWIKQNQEWIELGMIDSFINQNIIKNDLFGNIVDDKHYFLPIDTKYFKDIEKEILDLFDTKTEIDGWIINGDNYLALHSILPEFKNKIKTIYIDPPYNSSSNFSSYNDRFKSNVWLCMMENRLSLSYDLLQNNGILFTSIASNLYLYNETHRLGVLLEQIMDKRIVDLVWKKRGNSGSHVMSDAVENHETIMCYGKKDAELFTNLMPEEKLKEYKYVDEKGVFKWQDLTINRYDRNQRPNFYYGVVYDFVDKKILFNKSEKDINPEREVVIYPYKKRGTVWCCNKSSLMLMDKLGIVKVIEEHGIYRIMVKKYLYNDNGMINGYPIRSFIENKDLMWHIGYNTKGAIELSSLLPNVSFDTVKPLNLIKTLLYISTYGNDIVLDFFAGSGTTAHALFDLNKEDKQKRRVILIEKEKHNFYNIIIPRIKKVLYATHWSQGKVNTNPRIKQNLGYTALIKYFELEMNNRQVN